MDLPKKPQLTRLTVSQFKGIQKAEISLAPLNVIIGSNSMGKSSLIQSLLLIAQSVSRGPQGFASVNSTTLRLGTAEEIFRRSASKTSKTVSIGLEFSGMKGSESSQSVEFVLDRTVQNDRAGLVAATKIAYNSVAPARKLASDRQPKLSVDENVGPVETRILLRLDRQLTSAFKRQIFSAEETSSATRNRVAAKNKQFWTFSPRSFGILPDFVLVQHSFSSLAMSINESFNRRQQYLADSFRDKRRELDISFRELESVGQEALIGDLGKQFGSLKDAVDRLSFAMVSIRQDSSSLSRQLSALTAAQAQISGFGRHLKEAVAFQEFAHKRLEAEFERKIERVSRVVKQTEELITQFRDSRGDNMDKIDLESALIDLRKLEMVLREDCEEAKIGESHYYLLAERALTFRTRSPFQEGLERFKDKFGSSILESALESYDKLSGKGQVFYLASDRPLSPISSSVHFFDWSRRLGSQVHYLGPLREKDYADLDSADSDSNNLSPIGPKAERLGEFLRQEWSKKKFYPVRSQLEPIEVEFHVALEDWVCGYFKLGKKLIQPRDEGRLGPIVRLDGSRLLHLGTGVSQLLPVIALCLWARPGSTVILEQPELHLHPALQQKLGTFLALMSHSGRQIIVETHSEYLVTRIRRHVSEEHIQKQDCKIIFVQEGGKFIEKPPLLDDQDDDWPEEFFDFALDDNIAIASSRGD